MINHIKRRICAHSGGYKPSIAVKRIFVRNDRCERHCVVSVSYYVIRKFLTLNVVFHDEFFVLAVKNFFYNAFCGLERFAYNNIFAGLVVVGLDEKRHWRFSCIIHCHVFPVKNSEFRGGNFCFVHEFFSCGFAYGNFCRVN